MKYFLLALLSIFALGHAENITHNHFINDIVNGKHLVPLRRRLIAVTTISAIAATVTAAVNVAKVVTSNINSFGAAITIDNHFKYIDLHRVNWKIMEGEQLETVDETILKKHKGAGGVFSDKKWNDGSAGIVQYKATNPITAEIYCFEYVWAINARVIDVPFKVIEPIGGWEQVDNGASGMAIVVSTGSNANRCGKDIDTAFDDIKKYWIAAVKQNNPNWAVSPGVDWKYNFEGYWGQDTMIAFEGMETQKGLSIGSSDLRVGIKATMTNSLKTTIKITIGPYKKIFGDAHSGNWFVLQNGVECTSSGDQEKKLGQFENVNDCHKACKDEKGADCKYFLYGKNNKYGWCYWEGDCTSVKSNDYVLISNVEISSYEVVEYGRYCTGGEETYLGWYGTVDECAKRCTDWWPQCEYFIYGTGNDDMGYCYWEESCTSTTSGNYNTYVITANSNIFDSKSIQDKYIGADQMDNNKVHDGDEYLLWSVNGIGISFQVFMVLAFCIIIVAILFNVWCCVLIGKEKQSQNECN